MVKELVGGLIIKLPLEEIEKELDKLGLKVSDLINDDYLVDFLEQYLY